MQSAGPKSGELADLSAFTFRSFEPTLADAVGMRSCNTPGGGEAETRSSWGTSLSEPREREASDRVSRSPRAGPTARVKRIREPREPKPPGRSRDQPPALCDEEGTPRSQARTR